MNNYDYGYTSEGLEVVFFAFLIVFLCVIALAFVSIWKIFVKAGEPGWKSLIPLYNLYILTKITFGNGWLVLLCLLPGGVIFLLAVQWKLGTVFGKSGAFSLGLILLPFIFDIILALDHSTYCGAK